MAAIEALDFALAAAGISPRAREGRSMPKSIKYRRRLALWRHGSMTAACGTAATSSSSSASRVDLGHRPYGELSIAGIDWVCGTQSREPTTWTDLRRRSWGIAAREAAGIRRRTTIVSRLTRDLRCGGFLANVTSPSRGWLLGPARANEGAEFWS